MARLLAVPAEYDGKIVGVIGFLVFSAHESVIYDSSESARRGIAANGIGISSLLQEGILASMSEQNENFVMLVGEFRASSGYGSAPVSGSFVKTLELFSESDWGREQPISTKESY